MRWMGRLAHTAAISSLRNERSSRVPTNAYSFSPCVSTWLLSWFDCCREDRETFKGTLSGFSSSFCKFGSYSRMTTVHRRIKHICLPSFISNVTNNKKENRKAVRLTSFQRPQLPSVSIFFNNVHLCLLLYQFCIFFSLFCCFDSSHATSRSYTIPGTWLRIC